MSDEQIWMEYAKAAILAPGLLQKQFGGVIPIDEIADAMLAQHRMRFPALATSGPRPVPPPNRTVREIPSNG